jgi:hypothetical protein
MKAETLEALVCGQDWIKNKEDLYKYDCSPDDYEEEEVHVID